jgi:NADH/F420H2 dehydrogenase subunit C
MNCNLYLKFIYEVLKDKILSFNIIKNDYFLFIEPKNLYNVCLFLKDNQANLFKVLVDVTAVDFPNKFDRFSLNYCLLSVKFNTRLILNVKFNELYSIKSITSLYKSSCWIEREIWDMFGIFFKNHPDLRRILTDYGFSGYPLRKDFPLTGYLEMRYDDSQKRIIFESIEMSQEYRVFHFKNSWHFNLNN